MTEHAVVDFGAKQFWQQISLLAKARSQTDQVTRLSSCHLRQCQGLPRNCHQKHSVWSSFWWNTHRHINMCTHTHPRDGKCHGYDGYIRVKKLSSMGKNLGRTKNKCKTQWTNEHWLRVYPHLFITRNHFRSVLLVLSAKNVAIYALFSE